ncbi:MAG: isoprenylcysteine carboxylmethyltransferase family protein [Sphingomonadales bacterium]|jgi:protein-S-isoprenylcysteine O-methyltransferase Ste14|nr:isoprenylcysteine carboxylmethyltransferase family protein [Sphingomonadales bacterium]MBK6719000.1 isoprenylcysteine carboxylmethyltransferase family protein [Sphingomonadales bacterium]MBL0114602.1 isoprenylcysteine carboxylmethyltransferase family protein [Sphingomonadales bacterium]MBP6379463.1 isoprenylcysteine carboxylmethyltransferase family protein [Sphingorhabdus sp.]
MLHAIPFISLVTIFAASVLRGEAIRRKSGDRAWAFDSSKGKQRLAGLAFAASIVVLAIAGGVVAKDGQGEFPVIAAMLSGAGASIVIVAQVQMGRAWRVGVRHGDAPLFIRHGLFRFSRNPIFVGMMMIGLGVALNTSLWWVWLAWMAFVAACHVQVQIEEAHLRASFGDAYCDFASSTPRWIGIAR